MSRVETTQLSSAETTALRTSILGHDVDLLTGTCECGHIADLRNEGDRIEHLLEVAFRSGELFAIMTE